MISSIAALLLSGVALLSTQAQAQTIPADIVGTWNSKANSTMTGPVRIHRVCHNKRPSADMNRDRASTTRSTRNSPSPSTQELATPLPPTASTRSHTTAPSQIVCWLERKKVVPCGANNHHSAKPKVSKGHNPMATRQIPAPRKRLAVPATHQSRRPPTLLRSLLVQKLHLHALQRY